ncbi:hypothetical protein LEP1GSC067_4913 [Leptospira interrogans serovar Lora str. TE 1992]|uniref:SLEI domain protein, PF07620 family n=1 Tax=Leptospira interrogans serovar Lora str. TE 1992 TaxID=1193028 RepID=M3DUB0_LEPIR|nr:hypothetical protein LEP1GSC067_4913 [Leptospira interrogans serovar Lora str. TE 1992]
MGDLKIYLRFWLGRHIRVCSKNLKKFLYDNSLEIFNKTQ